ncbi:3-hydroxyacyl-CoA dehydrogenase NAD-binding domain-containing protein [Paenisporosarcina quisquiliarum]|uniref:L-gulonate 3-dehydrogenase n=1 Tax=Paenisporosarcina quisquiliarum TaxID=365346 RepID=A0A9X3LF27_9BACL|nr:3-hydroxyacyl-CoA dehydrogenase NAD-binding domain-containing protein [Paenisporosarcina quisquiliarum]MCZ8536840.1 3-hydroxyacyl-CoA dehydrogenase NAD-binding domain-containing protein [Paenisporosarcina quisquiliarum]
MTRIHSDLHRFDPVTVIGAGTIGLSWATLFLAHGLTVRLYDPRPDLKEVSEQHFKSIESTLTLLNLPSKGFESRLTLTSDLQQAVTGAAVIQENGPEKLTLKQELFANIENYVEAHTLLLSSSSTLPASDISVLMKDKSRMLIGHPFNPPLVMPLVEVVPGQFTSHEAVEDALVFYRALGKAPQHIQKEVFGFVANRLQFAMMREAMYLVDEGVVAMEDVDEIVKDSIGLRWAATGPMLGMHLGGGQGGMESFMRHLGPTMEKSWYAQGNLKMDEDTISRLATKSRKSYGHSTIDELAQMRDEKQMAILKTRHK